MEHVYLGVLGPSATWLWHRCGRMAAAREPSNLDMADLATSLGLGRGMGAHAPLSRTLSRLVWLDAARRNGDILAVRLALPDLPFRRLERLSPSARLAHHHRPPPHAPASRLPSHQRPSPQRRSGCDRPGPR